MSEIRRIGKIEGLNLPRLLIQLFQEGTSAIIDFQCEEIIKSLHLEKGYIIFARSNERSDRFGEYLVRNNIITEEALKSAAGTLVKTGTRLGKILVERGLLQPKELFSCVRKQITEIVISIFEWDEGLFRVHQELKPAEERIVLEKNTLELVLEGARQRTTRMNDWKQYVSEKDFVSLLNRELFSILHFTPDEEEVSATLKAPMTVPDLIKASSLDEEKVTSAFCCLFYLGAIGTIEQKAQQSSAVTTDVWEWSPELGAIFYQYNKAYRFIIRYIKIETGDQVNTELLDAFKAITDNCKPILEGLIPESDGTLNIDLAKQNALNIQQNQRVEKIRYAFEEYLYSLLFVAQKVLSPFNHRKILQELKPILAALSETSPENRQD